MRKGVALNVCFEGGQTAGKRPRAAVYTAAFIPDVVGIREVLQVSEISI